MKQLLVISGKGGTGKTTITASFAALGKATETQMTMADCDVDAADLHLLLEPEIIERHDFYGGKIAKIDQAKCQQCQECIKICRFQAIEKNLEQGIVKVNPILCEGCTVCGYVCPHGGIIIKDSLSGEWYVSKTCFGSMVHATLGIAEENSGKLVSQVLKKAREVSENEASEVLLVDGPPGIGCPVISSFSGTDLALMVTEPTVSGKHDLERILDLSEYFDVKAVVCINKSDLDDEMTESITDYCEGRGVEVVGKIPFDKNIPTAIGSGIVPVEYKESVSSRAIFEIYQQVLERL
ncbi:MAG: ATP-binding protein [Halanaerobiales bacterium]|nr:ATP-binding protein [Halanaerobiales bacterium]